MLARPDQVNARQLRGFALLLPFAFVFVLWMIARHSGASLQPLAAGSWPRWLQGLALVLLVSSVLGMLLPRTIRPLYLLLGWATWPIGVVVSTVLVGLLFYGLMTPIGWALRLRGRDSLLLRSDPRTETGSLWFERTSAAGGRSRYSRMS